MTGKKQKQNLIKFKKTQKEKQGITSASEPGVSDSNVEPAICLEKELKGLFKKVSSRWKFLNYSKYMSGEKKTHTHKNIDPRCLNTWI